MHELFFLSDPQDVIPCLTDLVRDWMRDKTELHKIIIHKVADTAGKTVGRIILDGFGGGGWIVGYIDDTYVDLQFANEGKTGLGIIHAADPEFFDKLYEDFLKIISRYKHA